MIHAWPVERVLLVSSKDHSQELKLEKNIAMARKKKLEHALSSPAYKGSISGYNKKSEIIVLH